jgi:vitellogenic carboxypeptidase-like protein
VKEYNVLFVDQPVGTGLSYADPTLPDPYVIDEANSEVADDFYNALHELYINPNGCFPGLGITPNMDLFIFGESYAGKYVPAIAAKILN